MGDVAYLRVTRNVTYGKKVYVGIATVCISCTWFTQVSHRPFVLLVSFEHTSQVSMDFMQGPLTCAQAFVSLTHGGK